jgi:hypothetical protein
VRQASQTRLSHQRSAQAANAAMRWTAACQLRDLLILECDFQGHAKPCGELSDVILPVFFLGKIAALAPAAPR